MKKVFFLCVLVCMCAGLSGCLGDSVKTVSNINTATDALNKVAQDANTLKQVLVEGKSLIASIKAVSDANTATKAATAVQVVSVIDPNLATAITNFANSAQAFATVAKEVKAESSGVSTSTASLSTALAGLLGFISTYVYKNRKVA